MSNKKTQSQTETDDSPRIEPEFEEPQDGHERANIAIEEEGGLPEDNPFTETVKELHEDGESWGDIYDKLGEIHEVVGVGYSEEMNYLVPDWQVTAIVPDEQATSGERFETYTRSTKTPEEAEQLIREKTGGRIALEKTEQVGYSKVG